MSVVNPSPPEIAGILERAKRIAVVGLSGKPDRASNLVARFLVARGYEVIPVNPVEEEILGLRSYGSLAEIEGNVDIVDVFRRSDQTDPIIDEAIALGAGVLWLQEGVVNEAGAERARAAGMTVLQDICIKKELSRL